MKNLTTLTLAAILGLALGSTAFAQNRPGGLRGQRPPKGPPPAGEFQRPGGGPVAFAHLTTVYATLAPFDANQDGQLEDAEKAALAQAIAEGTIQAPPHRTPPPGVTPDPERMLSRLAELFAAVAPYDANHDGQLDETEQAALKTAIENGELPPPGGPRGKRPQGAGGPRGQRMNQADCRAQ